jgi:hypothetical protein
MNDSSILKIKAAGSSETLVPIYRNTLRHIPTESNLNIYCLENLKSHTFSIINRFLLVNFSSASYEMIIAKDVDGTNRGLY